MNSSIYVSITGGLGNQLFGLAAGIEQATRLGCELVLLRENFRLAGNRNFWLDKLELPSFVTIDEAAPRLKFPKRRVHFTERGFNYDSRVCGVKPGTLLEGYFQSPKYFFETQDLVQSIVFPKNTIQPVSQLGSAPFTAFHVRRGDYLNPETKSFHGLAGPDYFKRALGLLGQLHGEQRLIAFSDSPQQIRSEFGGLDLAYEVFDGDDLVDDLTTLRTLAQASRLVMSNSSFSWWAAWNIEKSGAVPAINRIVAPRPWFADGHSAMDLLLPSWISLG